MFQGFWSDKDFYKIIFLHRPLLHLIFDSQLKSQGRRPRKWIWLKLSPGTHLSSLTTVWTMI